MFHQFLPKPCLWYGKPIAPVRKLVVVCRRNHSARLCLQQQVLLPELLWGRELLTFLCPWSMCSSWLFGDAASPRWKRLEQQKGLQLPGAHIQQHFATGLRYSERRFHFGRRGLTLLACINFCWLVSAMHRNLRQLMLTSDSKPALHGPGCSSEASQASTAYQPTAGRCSVLT